MINLIKSLNCTILFYSITIILTILLLFANAYSEIGFRPRTTILSNNSSTTALTTTTVMSKNRAIEKDATDMSLLIPTDTRWRVSTYAIDILISVLDSKVLMPVLDFNFNISYAIWIIPSKYSEIHMLSIFINVGIGYLTVNPSFVTKLAIGIGFYDSIIMVGWYIAGYYNNTASFDTGLFVTSKYLMMRI